jgi:pantothenate kinase-related protein Tda10
MNDYVLFFIKALQKVINCSISDPLKVMISGAPASGKGTQCEFIVNKVRVNYLFPSLSLSLNMIVPVSIPQLVGQCSM